MQKLIVVAAVLACALAAPVENIKETFQITDLSRPSPINPDIPSDPKPEDKVTLIADPKQVRLVESKATPKPLGPYALPSEPLLRSRRADTDSSESGEDSRSSEEDSDEKKKKQSPPLKARPIAGPLADLQEKTAAKTSTTPTPSSTESNSSDANTSDASTSIAPVISRKPYSPDIHQHNAYLIKPANELNTGDSIAASTSATTTSAPSVVASNDDHTNDKRDIPVPLTRKQPHNDDDETKKQTEQHDAAKAPKEEVKQEDKKDEDQKAEPTPHPATIQHPISVAELFAKKPSE